MQFIPSDTYYARSKVNGKSVHAPLETDVLTVAKLRLADKRKKLKSQAAVATFADGRLKYEAETQNDHTLALIIPALCARDATPFRLFADGIEAQNSAAFPARRPALLTWQLACELSGHSMPFMATGERADVEHGAACNYPGCLC